MASGSVRPVAVPPEARVAADKVIDSQLGRVRRHIRITDLIAGIMVLFAGVFAFLILVAVVDHWIVGLGVAGRLLVLLALIGGAGWHLAVNVVPLLLRRINPAYAAQTIERSEPTLKNSLLNYLLLRRDSAGVQAQIYQAVQQRAAADVSRVEVDQTVDRSTLIRAGYALVAIMAVAAAYKILSPKDPFQTVRRIASPWSDIARPARVTIEAVEPGNADVIQGQIVEVSAIVRGDRAGEDVKLICSSVDGQVVDQFVVMKPDSAGLRHVAHLPPGGSGKQPGANQQSANQPGANQPSANQPGANQPGANQQRGIQQDLVYRISAGDASTPEFRLRASPAPTITVDTVEYDFPAYTQRPREVVEHQGDLKAVEGTRVTVRARANQPIRTATIELTSSATAGAAKGLSERLAMEFRDTGAWRIWTLELAADRQSPKFSAYQATFVNQTGLASRDPVTHRIEVVPDLPPEVEILTPNKETVQVPVSGEQRIEIRAIDPDFGLSGLWLKAVCAGREILDQPLLENSIGQSGQLIVEFKFRPRDHQLSAGSQVTYWAVAADNRHTETSPQPNTARTPNRTLVIVDDPQEPPTKPGETAADKTEAPASDSQPTPSSTNPKSGDKTQPPNPNDKRDPDQRDPDQKEQQGDQGSRDKQPAGGQSNSKQQPGKQSSDQQKGGASGKGQPQSADGQPGNQQNGGNSGASPPGASQPGQGASGQKPGGNTVQQNSPGTKETSPGNDPNAVGDVREGVPPGQRSEPLHDGEVFEKALERLKQQQQQEKSNQQQPPTTPDANDQNESQGSATKNRDETEGTTAKAKDESKASPDETSKPGSAKKKSPQETTPPDRKAKSTDKTGGSTDQGKPQPGPDQDPNQAGQNQAGQNQADKNQADKNQAGKNQAGKNQAGKNQTGKKSSDGSEKGTASGKKESGQPKQERSPKAGEQAKPGTPKQPGANDQGQSGAGQKDDDKTGSVEKTTPQGDRPMTQQPDNATSPPGDPPPPNQSERSSDSKGQESGDRKGGGKKGAGQGANQAGKDTAGSNSASDEGAGAAKEPGQGEKSSSPGKQQPSPTPNPKSSPGTEKGPGSQSKSDPQGNQPSPQPAPDASAQPPDQNKNQNQNKQPESGRPDGSGKSPGGQGIPTGGGQAADNPAGTPPANAEAAPGDDANLDYSRRATDMVLEYLKDQKDKPDERLLDELGWTAEDLRGFLERWQKLKQSAAEDPAVRRDLEETLRGLGLRPQSDSKRTGGNKSDDVRGLRESGIKSVPPSSYQEQFNAFKKGTSRSQPK